MKPEEINRKVEEGMAAGLTSQEARRNIDADYAYQQRLGAMNQTITADSLGGNAQPITLPEPKISTTADRITGKTEGLLELDRLAQKAAQERADKEAELKASESKTQSLLEKIGLTKSSRTTLEEDKGVPQLRETARKAANDLLVSQRAELNQIRALEGAGLTDVQRAAQVREIRRKSAFEQADYQLTYHLANSDLNAAETVINDKITLELEPLYEQLDLQKNVYSQISNSLSKAEDREWNAAIKNTETAIAERKELAKYKGDIAITASQNGTPLPSYIQAEINRAESQEEVNKILADNKISLAKPVVAGSGTGSNQQTDNERALMSQFRGEQIVKDYNDILGQKGTIDALYLTLYLEYLVLHQFFQKFA